MAAKITVDRVAVTTAFMRTETTTFLRTQTVTFVKEAKVLTFYEVVPETTGG